jgi:hypothetical protein
MNESSGFEPTGEQWLMLASVLAPAESPITLRFLGIDVIFHLSTIMKFLGTQVTSVVEEVIVGLRLQNPGIEFLLSDQGKLGLLVAFSIIMPVSTTYGCLYATQMHNTTYEDVSRLSEPSIRAGPRFSRARRSQISASVRFKICL